MEVQPNLHARRRAGGIFTVDWRVLYLDSPFLNSCVLLNRTIFRIVADLPLGPLFWARVSPVCLELRQMLVAESGDKSGRASASALGV